ncbi:putative developmental regulator, ULTRAPETALA [Helianthus annuus]|nr:putative developmental regulator, ULTRAPETALA [Helianthus annuus]
MNLLDAQNAINIDGFAFAQKRNAARIMILLQMLTGAVLITSIITCDDDEERASRRVYRGCTRSPSCRGCTSCVCFGCDICRFSDCSCQTCIDFTNNSKA